MLKYVVIYLKELGSYTFQIISQIFIMIIRGKLYDRKCNKFAVKIPII